MTRSTAMAGSGPVALRIAGPTEQAIEAALRALDALRKGDRLRIQEALAAELVRVFPRFGRDAVPRAVVVEAFVRLANRPRRPRSRPRPALDELIDRSQVRVDTVGDRFPNLTPDRRLAADDYIVRVPFRPPQNGEPGLRNPSWGWTDAATLLVRVGPPAVIVGL